MSSGEMNVIRVNKEAGEIDQETRPEEGTEVEAMITGKTDGHKLTGTDPVDQSEH